MHFTAYLLYTTYTTYFIIFAVVLIMKICRLVPRSVASCPYPPNLCAWPLIYMQNWQIPASTQEAWIQVSPPLGNFLCNDWWCHEIKCGALQKNASCLQVYTPYCNPLQGRVVLWTGHVFFCALALSLHSFMRIKQFHWSLTEVVWMSKSKRFITSRQVSVSNCSSCTISKVPKYRGNMSLETEGWMSVNWLFLFLPFLNGHSE